MQNHLHLTGGIRLFEITIARRYITARRRQTALSITAIALAVSIYLVIMSLAISFGLPT